jgi:GMP synthase-like glutamine amidotransferase
MRVLSVKNISIEGLGYFGRFFSEAGWDITTVDLQAGGLCPVSPENFDAVVILGGPMNVYEYNRYPFLKDEIRLVENSLKKEVPLLGLCLGAQLISVALGADVSKNRVKEIGWYSVGLTGSGKTSRFFNGFPESFKVFQWHGDTFAIPNSAERLAGSLDCENQAFSYGSALALQFHIEVEASDVKTWGGEYIEELRAEHMEGSVEKLEADTRKNSVEVERLCKALFTNLFSNR